MAEARLTSQMRIVNYLINFTKNTKEKKSPALQTIEYFESRLKLLERYYSDLYSRHDVLIHLAEDYSEHEYFTNNCFELAELAYVDSLTQLNSDIARLCAPPPGSLAVQPGSSPPASPPASVATEHVKRFTSLIMSKREYADVDKLQYLLSSIEGKAAKSLSGLEVTAANFKVARDRLVERYDNKCKRLSTHLDSLIQLPTLRSRNVQDLEDLLDAVIVSVRGLQDLGCPIDSYDPRTRESWEISQEGTEGFYTYENLLAFLKRRLQTLDTAHGKGEARTDSGSLAKSTNSSHGKRKTQSASAHTASVSESPSPSNKPSNKGSYSCFVCQDKHSLRSCEQFKSMTPPERFSSCKEAKLCLNCLRKSHSVAEYPSRNRCFICKKPHHTKLHFDGKPPADAPSNSDKRSLKTAASSNSTSPTTVVHLASVKRSVLLATAVVIVSDRFGKELLVRALIDPGAQRSFISERIAAQLTLERRPVSVSIVGVGGQAASLAKGEVALTIKSRIDPQFNCICNALVLPKVTSLLPPRTLAPKKWPHLDGLSLADSKYFLPSVIDLIIGADLYGLILQDGFARGLADAPIAQNTVFGWILTGLASSPDSDLDSGIVSACHVLADNQLSQALLKFWEIEEVPFAHQLSPEDEYCEQYFDVTTTRSSEGRFVVRLPLAARETFPDSRAIAVSCLRRSEKRRSREPELSAAYSKFMLEYEQLGHMRVANAPPKDDFHFFLPHHGVFRGASTKIRVVFNGSQKTSSGHSLNDILLPGPKLQPEITLVITRWRFQRVAIVTDIIKMFRQFLVHQDDLDWQRLVWRDSAENLIEDYVAFTVTYGTTSAPFLAMRSLLQLAKEGEMEHPLASLLLKYQTYIDDIFLGADDDDRAITMRDQVIGLLSTAGLRLGKWSSNRPQLLRGLHESDVCDLPFSSEDVVSTLGLHWDTRQDSFLFSTALPSLPALISKRTVLSDTARLFYPLGFIAPVLIRAKIFLQDLWLRKFNWDDPLPRELLDHWLEFRNSLIHLPDLRIPRWLGTGSDDMWHLHGFADASMRAYATVIYAVVPGRSSTIIMAKTRVAPVKVETLPRLELCAATLLVRLASHLVGGSLQLPSSLSFWTDSKVVLDWLNSHASKWPTFVTNRVSEISSTFPNAVWRHVRSKENPADCASSGVTPLELADFPLWWHGPEWILNTPASWSNPSTATSEKSDALLAHESAPHDSKEDYSMLAALEKISEFSKILRVIAYCRKWRSVTRRRPCLGTTTSGTTRQDTKGHQSLPGITAREYSDARFTLTRLIQAREFSTEISCLSAGKSLSPRSPLVWLAPFLDDKGLLRVGGRLQNAAIPYSERHPIILPGRCHVVKLLVEETHRITLRGDVQLMKSILRQSYWIIRGNRLIVSIYRRCVKCIRHGARHLEQQMAPLPADRLTPGRPFQITGLDYAGPFPILFSKGRGAKSTKGYVAIFICFVVKAVHIEVVSDLTTDCFLSAFSRFVARRGLCSKLLSDNATNFKGADAELRRLFTESSKFFADGSAQLARQQVDWSFIPPRASHFGGLWEAAVRSFKHHLRRAVGSTTLTYEEFSTLAIKIEACLNSQPLCSLSTEANDPAALTPGHFIIGSAPLAFPEPMHESSSKMTYRSRWQLVSQLRDSFWHRWRKEVVSQLQLRNKWLKLRRNLQPGDVDIVTDELSPAASWPLAVVSQVHPGKDGLVRVATVPPDLPWCAPSSSS